MWDETIVVNGENKIKNIVVNIFFERKKYCKDMLYK